MADEKEFGYQLGEKKVWIKAKSREEANEHYRKWAETPRGKEVIEKYGGQEEAKTTAAGLAKSAGTGLARGVAGTVGLPGLVEQGLNWLGERGAALAGVKVDDPVSGALNTLDPILGSGVVPVGWKEGDPLPKKGTFFPTMDENLETIEGLTGELYDPQTSAEKFMATGTEFATGIALPGGGGASLVRGGKALAGAAGKKAAAKKLAKELAKQRAKDAKQYAKIAQGGTGVATVGGRAAAAPGTDIAKRAAETMVAKAGGVPASQKAINLTAAAGDASDAARALAATGKGQLTSGAYLAGSQLAAGVGSEAAGQATEGTSYEPWARLAGGVLGGFAPNIAARAVSPGAIKSQAAYENYKALKDRGVEMSPGMMTQNKSLQSIEGMFATVPLGKDPLEHFHKSFSKAVLRTTGLSDEAISTLDDYSRNGVLSLVDKRKKEIGKILDASFDQVNVYHKFIPDELKTQLDNIEKRIGNYRDLVMDHVASNKKIPGADEYYDLKNYFVNTGKINGAQWDNLRRRLNDYVDDAGSDAQRRFYRNLLNDIDDFMLDAASVGQITPTVEVAKDRFESLVDALRNARHQYKNASIIEDALGRADNAATHGYLTPKNLRTALNKRDGGRAGASGDLRTLEGWARESFTPYPDSGSASRIMTQGTLQQLMTQATNTATAAGSAGAGGIASAMAGLSVAPGMIMGFLFPGVVSRAYDNPAVRAYLTSQRGQKFIRFINDRFDDIRVNEVGDLVATNPKTAVELRKHLELARKPADRKLLQRVIDAQEQRALQAGDKGKAAVSIPFDEELQKEITKFNRKVRARQLADKLRRGQYINQAVDTESGRATLSQPDEE